MGRDFKETSNLVNSEIGRDSIFKNGGEVREYLIHEDKKQTIASNH